MAHDPLELWTREDANAAAAQGWMLRYGHTEAWGSDRARLVVWLAPCSSCGPCPDDVNAYVEAHAATDPTCARALACLTAAQLLGGRRI